MFTEEQPDRPTRQLAVLVVCCVAQFMIVLDISIVTVALPQMGAVLHLSAGGQQWVVNAYTLTFAGFLLLGGRSADIFGRRRVFLLGLGLFTASSLLGGMAQSGGWLIAARAAQGLGGALLAPATLSVLTTTFEAPDQRRRALGAWAATSASGVAIGVLAGGILTELAGWRWVLFVNGPIGVLLFLAALTFLRGPRAAATHGRLDLPGAITATAGLSIIVYAIISTQTRGWASTTTVVSLAAGSVLLLTFGLIEARVAARPLVPLSVFRRRHLTTANLISLTFGFAQFGMYIFLSFFFQRDLHYSPLKTGLAFLPVSLSTMMAALAAPRLVPLLGVRRQLMTAPIGTVIGLVWFSQLGAGADYMTSVLVPEVLAGLGFGLSLVPLTMAATTDVAPRDAGLASGLVNTTRQVGGALGVAVLGTIAATATAAHGGSTATALTDGYDRTFAVAAVVMLVGVALAATLPRAVASKPSAEGPSRGTRHSARQRANALGSGGAA